VVGENNNRITHFCAMVSVITNSSLLSHSLNNHDAPLPQPIIFLPGVTKEVYSYIWIDEHGQPPVRQAVPPLQVQ
jgi:hypothetical protein